MIPPPAVAPPRWSRADLDDSRHRAIIDFRHERMEEPIEDYLALFDHHAAEVRQLLATTDDLSQLGEHALDLLCHPRLAEVLRYLAGPPISLDDLKVVAEVDSLAPARLRAAPELGARLAEQIKIALDRRRFGWLAAGRPPTDGEREAAVVATAALMATQRQATKRRLEGKTAQEDRVRVTLLERGFRQVPARDVSTLGEAPRAGEFSTECLFAGRKADLVVGLYDGRSLALECKVSNSATNSIKRLNNDAAVKAEVWRREFGERHVVPAAVLSGVYNLGSLEEAQHRGLALFWAHDLAALIRFVDATR